MADELSTITQAGKPSVATTESSYYGEDLYEHVTEGLVYVDTSCPGPGVDGELFYSQHKGCQCQSGCKTSACSCLAQSRRAAEFPRFSGTDGGIVYPVLECNSGCPCELSCPNRVTQRGPRRGLKIEDVAGKGFGVFTERDIPESAFICEYAGEVIGEAEARRRLRSTPQDTNYVLVLREHTTSATDGDIPQNRVTVTVIDPTVVGNIGRYLNHSCDPNVHLRPVRVQSLVPIAAVFATRIIRAGEELCYDYDDVCAHAQSDSGIRSCDAKFSCKMCVCGAAQCRGFLPSNDHLF